MSNDNDQYKGTPYFHGIPEELRVKFIGFGEESTKCYELEVLNKGDSNGIARVMVRGAERGDK